MQHMPVCVCVCVCVCACVCACACVCVLVVFTDRHQSTAMNPNVLTRLVQNMMLARQLTQPSAHLPLKGLSPQQQSQVLSQYNHDQQRAPAPMQPMVHRLPTCLHNSLSVPLHLLLLLEWMASCGHCLLLAHACGRVLICLFMLECMAAATCCMLTCTCDLQCVVGLHVWCAAYVNHFLDALCLASAPV